LQQQAESVAKVVHRMNGWVDCWIIGSMEADTINPFIHQSINPDRSAPCLESLISQRLHRIDTCPAARRKPAGEQGNAEQQQGSDRESDGVDRANAEEQAAEKLRQHRRSDQTQSD